MQQGRLEHRLYQLQGRLVLLELLQLALGVSPVLVVALEVAQRQEVARRLAVALAAAQRLAGASEVAAQVSQEPPAEAWRREASVGGHFPSDATAA